MHTSILGSTPLFPIGMINLREIYLLLVSKRVESCVATTFFNIGRRLYLHYIGMFKPSCNRYKTRLQMKFNIPLHMAITRQQAFSFLGLKIWTKISHSTENLKTMASFTYTLKRLVKWKLCTEVK